METQPDPIQAGFKGQDPLSTDIALKLGGFRIGCLWVEQFRVGLVSGGQPQYKDLSQLIVNDFVL